MNAFENVNNVPYIWQMEKQPKEHKTAPVVFPPSAREDKKEEVNELKLPSCCRSKKKKKQRSLAGAPSDNINGKKGDQRKPSAV